MQIAMSRTREQFPLSRKKIIKKTIAGTFGLVIFFGILYALFVGLAGRAAVGGYLSTLAAFMVGFLFLIFVLNYLYQQWYWAVYFYDLTDDYIVIKKGPITPREITIPYERIQDVYVDQDILDRIFGLYDVHLSSATISSGMEAHIDGVEKAAADGLRLILLKTVQERISKHKGQGVLGPNP